MNPAPAIQEIVAQLEFAAQRIQRLHIQDESYEWKAREIAVTIINQARELENIRAKMLSKQES